MRIRVHEARDDSEWDRYATNHPGYTIYHGRAFHEAIAEAFGKASHGLIAEDGTGSTVGIMPLIRQCSRLFGDRLVSLPYTNHGGPLVDGPEVALGLFEAAAAEADRLGCDQLEVRDHESRELDWAMHADKVLMTRMLPSSLSQLDQALGAKLRSQCRRALKQGAVVERGGPQLIPDFFEVFAANMRDLGTPVYPRRWFEVLARHLGDAMRLVVVRMEGQPVAGCVLMRWRSTLEIPWAASARAFNRYSVNMLLYREALGLAIATGCRSFDFGRSTRGSGPWRFKQQWGAEEKQIYWRMRPGSDAPGRSRELLRRAWARLPLPLASRLGPMISADLPW